MPNHADMDGKKRALVIGGSMAGLFAALLLERAGWDARIFERSDGSLSDRGTGIVTHAELFDALDQCGIDTESAKVGVSVIGRRVFDRDGRICAELPLPQILTSWGHLYALLKKQFPAEKYHYNSTLCRIEQTGDTVVAHFKDGRVAEAELLIGADGIHSTVRTLLAPDVTPAYVGYIAWRGLVREGDLSAKVREELCDHFCFCLPPGEQMLGYPVAGENEAMERGQRRFNFVWYRPADDETLHDLLTDCDGVQHTLSVPPNKIRHDHIVSVRRAAEQVLSPQFAEVIERTGHPFIQVIQDLLSPEFRLSPRIAILGDAASVARPHVGMGVTKAAGDAVALVEALAQHPDDLTRALDLFATRRQAYSSVVVQRARQLGAYMQAQLFTDEERAYAERHRKPQAVMTETAATIAIRL